MADLEESHDDRGTVGCIRYLPHLPNEALLAVIARVEFSTENFTNLSLVSKHIHGLMKTHMRQILNDIAVVQFPEPNALRQDIGDHSVSSILDLRGASWCTGNVVQSVLQFEWNGIRLLQHGDPAQILTSSFLIYDALCKLQIEPHSEGNATALLLCLGHRAVSSMYYASILLCLYLARKAAKFRHQRWLRVFSHPAAISVIQMVLVRAGIGFFSVLAMDDELWVTSGRTHHGQETGCRHHVETSLREAAGVRFSTLIASISARCWFCSASEAASITHNNDNDIGVGGDEQDEHPNDFELRVAERFLENYRDGPNCVIVLLRHQFSNDGAADWTVELSSLKDASWCHVIQTELFWQSRRFTDVAICADDLIDNVVNVVKDYDRMDPGDVERRAKLIASPDTNSPISVIAASIAHSCAIDWGRYVTNKVYGGDFEMWPTSNTVLDNAQEAASQIKRALEMRRRIKAITEKVSAGGEQPEPYQVLLEVHKMYARLQEEKPNVAGS